ncbi:conserved membrane hypothetical protein [[Clostridium] ultunense Esp]|nr:conserved membrane hypothetical protein [[Clostridium] ultunense Esp]
MIEIIRSPPHGMGCAFFHSVHGEKKIVHKKIVIAVSMLLFLLLATVSVVISDLHDRFLPEQLGVKSKVSLDFTNANMSAEEAFRQLGLISDRLGLGLMKVAPDLGGDRSGQVFVKVGTQGSFPEKIRRFGDQPDAEIRESNALAHSFANGDYLVTGEAARIDEFKDWLTAHRVHQRWSGETFSMILQFLVIQSDFGITLLAAVALMVSLALYWLAVKARGRALRVLAGVSTWRIQYEDLVGFLVAMAVSAAILDIFAVTYVGLAYGWVFVPYYSKVLLASEAIVVLTTMGFAFALSVASWPSPTMLAKREPAVKSLQKSSVALKVVTFTLLLATVAPAFTAYMQSKQAAEEQAMWNAMADQVVLSFPTRAGVTSGEEVESNFQQLMPGVGDMVREAEARNAIALSNTYPPDFLSMNKIDITPYRYLTIINRKWLDLMLDGNRDGETQGNRPVPGLVPLSLDQIPEDAKQFIKLYLLHSSRNQKNQSEVLNEIKFYRYNGPGKLPFVQMGGELVFPKANEALILLVPGVYEVFDDSDLTSIASSRELLFTGLEATQRLLAERGLQGRILVKYMAEEGILRAQVAAYFAWLRVGSLVALIVALTIAASIGAFITAVLKAKRDFPLRLGGKSWWMILRERVMGEWFAGAAMTLLVMLLQGSQGIAFVAATGAMVLLLLPPVHFVTARWVFTKVGLRRL